MSQTTDVVGLVQTDLNLRRQLGLQRYGQMLDLDDGRDWLQEAYEEALDQTVYLRAALEKARKALASPEDRAFPVWPRFTCGSSTVVDGREA